MLSLQLRQLAPFRGMVGELVIGEDSAWNDVGSHVETSSNWTRGGAHEAAPRLRPMNNGSPAMHGGQGGPYIPASPVARSVQPPSTLLLLEGKDQRLRPVEARREALI